MKLNFKTLKYLSLLSQVGIVMAVPIFGGVFLGEWIDTKLGTQGIFLILFILMGIYVSFRNLYVTVFRKTDFGKKDKHL